MPVGDKESIGEKKEIITTASSVSNGEKHEVEEIIITESTNEKSDNGKSNNEQSSNTGFASGQSNNTKFCSNCGKAIDINAEICPKCGVRVARPPNSLEKNPTIAAILSFFICGLGQIYNGEIGKGLLLLISFSVCMFLGGLLAIILIGLLFFPIALVIWIYGIYDAYSTATEMNQ